MERNQKNIGSTTIIWVSAFILANFRGTVFWDVLQQGLQVTRLPLVEIFLWVTLLALAGIFLIRENLLTSYFMIWGKNKFLMTFVLVAALSIFWSVSFSFSLYRCLLLICSSAIAAYLGLAFSIKDTLNALFRFGTLLLIVCLVVVIFLPVVGVMLWEPYTGSWRGIFWHKNHFGGIAALFNVVFLIGAVDEFGKEKNKAILNAVFYLFSIVLIYFAKSAAGYILFAVMNIAVLLAFAWLRIRHLLKPIHYYSMLGFAALVAVMTFMNLDIVFSLVGRDATLTGRSALWSYLFTGVVSRSPILGYGFGAIWSFNSFRISTQQILGWGFPVVIADNGFLDILLHVGLIGFIPFVGILIQAAKSFFRYALERRTILSFAPLLILFFVLLANISFSFFLEVESFMWLVLIMLLFSVEKELQVTSS